MEKILLTAGDGARAEVYLHGGQVTSWVAADGLERLFLSERSKFLPGEAIRGGAPVIFPQFGDQGPLRKHGFARRLTWEFLGAEESQGSVVGKFALNDSAETRSAWPAPFHLELAVRVGGPVLELALAVHNPGPDAFEFTGALHTYLRAAEVGETHIEGLEGHETVDTTVKPPAREVQSQKFLTFHGEVDRIYPGAPDQVGLRENQRALRVEKDGFPDLVVWNPGQKLAAALADLGVNDYRRFVCIEAGVVTIPRRVEPGETWRGAQRLTVEPPPDLLSG